MLLTLVGRLVSVMINIWKNQNWGGGVCVCVWEGGAGEKKEEKGRMRGEER